MSEISFKDRTEAGEKLAGFLEKYRNKEAIILALPRGGVPVAKVVAKKLILPLGLVIVRKIGHPFNSEYAVAAISENGQIIQNDEEVKDIDARWFDEESKKQLEEAKRRREKYWGGRQLIDLSGKTAIIVDDGLATGLTMRAAIKEVKNQKPKEIVVAVPVAPKDTANIIKKEVDKFIAVTIPKFFMGAVGNYYDNFPQITDEEVINIIKDPEEMVLLKMESLGYLAKSLSKNLSYLREIKYDLVHFPSQEIQVSLHQNMEGKVVVFLGTIAPPAENLMESFLVCHTLKKEGAKKIIAVFPYLAYMRQDKNEPKKSLAVDFISKLAKKVSIAKIITIDIHSNLAKRGFAIPVVSLSPAKIFAQKIREMKFAADSIVAPDKGALDRAEQLRKDLGIEDKVIRFEKQRAGRNVELILMDVEPKSRVIIVDDILDTGKTLISCAQTLVKLGVKEIVVAVTHGLFTGEKWRRLFDHKVIKIITTDSIPSAREKESSKIEVLPVAPILINYFKIQNPPLTPPPLSGGSMDLRKGGESKKI